MASTRLKIVFWALVLIFLVIVSQFLVSVVREAFRGDLFFFGPIALFCVLGATLIVLVLKEQELPKWRKRFLFLTGASATGFFVFVFLHNAFYALAEIAKQITVLRYALEVLHVVFFLMAIPVCPLAFLAGMIGSIWFFIKKR